MEAIPRADVALGSANCKDTWLVCPLPPSRKAGREDSYVYPGPDVLAHVRDPGPLRSSCR